MLLFTCSVVPIYGQSKRPLAPCPTVVGLLVTQFVYRTPISQLQRVEIRQCDAGSETLQIVAWESRESTASLVIDTTDFTVVQTAARQSVYVIETTGGPRDQIYVIAYKDGKPRLALQRVTKGTATIKVDSVSIELLISGIYAGDAEPRQERHLFELK